MIIPDVIREYKLHKDGIAMLHWYPFLTFNLTFVVEKQTYDMGCPSVYVCFNWLMNKAILANGLAQ